jgi:hypothetical protein
MAIMSLLFRWTVMIALTGGTGFCHNSALAFSPPMQHSFHASTASSASASAWLLFGKAPSTAAATATTTTAAAGVTRINHHAIHNAPRTATALRATPATLLDQSLLFNTWEWCANLGSPAALVAGAVLATMVEGRETMAPQQTDSFSTRMLKKWCRFLLLSSFGLEVISIFVTTVTGTMLLSMGDVAVTTRQVKTSFITPIGFLMHNFEFEFLTARICFLQGLFHWLGSVALEVLIPKPGEGKSVLAGHHHSGNAVLLEFALVLLRQLWQHVEAVCCGVLSKVLLPAHPHVAGAGARCRGNGHLWNPSLRLSSRR